MSALLRATESLRSVRQPAVLALSSSFSACLEPRPCDGQEDSGLEAKQLDGFVERRLSSQSASTSADALTAEASRWQEMQAALEKKLRNGSSHDRREFPTHEEAQKFLSRGAAACSTGPQSEGQPAGTSLDWRIAAKAAIAANSAGLQSRALTDSFGRKHTYLRISLTERCNLRCLYCMPEEGAPLTPSSHLLTSQEIIRLAQLFVRAGVTKIRLTGGEPTLRRDLLDLTAQLNAIPGLQNIGITTNGIALQRNLAALKMNGLNLLNMSLDTLRPDRFERMTRRQGLERVLQTIELAVQLGFDPVKVNVVVMRGQNDDEIPDFVEMTRNKPINIRFIEYMPFDGNIWSHEKLVSFREMKAAVERRFGPNLEPLQDPKGEVAKNFRLPGFRGSVSFITSMTKAFCSDCNRLRLMADGNLKVCLFGANEVSLRDAMRQGASDEELLAIISAAVDRKKAAHAGMFELSRTKNRAMVHIGG